MRVLVVCTANVCRSPVVERLLARELTDAGHRVMVRSAGTHGGRLDLHEHTVRAAAQVGVDIRDHRSRLLTAELVATEGADLVVAMTREHVRTVVGFDPAAWPRTFTLKELARRGLEAPLDVITVDTWLAAIGAGRRAAEMMTPSPHDDLADPYGGPYAEHADMVAEAAALTSRIARLVPRPA